MEKITVRFRKLHPAALVPQYMTSGAAGCDAFACLNETMVVAPGKRAALSTGLSIEIPQGYEVQVRPRSGLAWKNGLTVVNAPGTIDSDYRGEVKVLVINLGEEAVIIKNGDRIAQLVLQKVDQIDWQEVDSLGDSARGAGGFGSTGVHPPSLS